MLVKESIAKVKSWKQQLRGSPPPDDESANSIFGKDDWRKRKTLARGSSVQEASSAARGKAQPRTFAGVPGFPPVESAAAGDSAGEEGTGSRLPAGNRAVSPYDNLKPAPRHPPQPQQLRAAMTGTVERVRSKEVIYSMLEGA